MGTSDRGVSIAAWLAVFGALVAIAALLRKWLQIDEDAVTQYLLQLQAKFAATHPTAQLYSTEQVRQVARNAIASQDLSQFRGYKAIGGPWIVAYMLAVLGAGWSAFHLLAGRRPPAAAPLGSAALVAGVAYHVIHAPYGAKGFHVVLGYKVEYLQAAGGAHTALVAAGLVAAAGVLTLLKADGTYASVAATATSTYAPSPVESFPPSGAAYPPSGVPYPPPSVPGAPPAQGAWVPRPPDARF